jgi:AbrB family looped-hinge helix DNA binding protein
MPKELFPSSYLCDCGHQSDFCENTIREVKAMSQKRLIRLGDSAPDEHIIVFYKGEMVGIICPQHRPDPQRSADAEPSTVRQVTVSSKGSIVIPAALRRRYGLVPGSIVDVEDRNGEIVLSVRIGYKEARGMLSAGPSLTADLLAERAKDREREEARLRTSSDG